jgi:hypothetical protein
VPERAIVIPQDAEFAGALVDLLAHKSRVENVGEFPIVETVDVFRCRTFDWAVTVALEAKVVG